MSFAGPLIPRQRVSRRSERWSWVALGLLTLAAIAFDSSVGLVSSFFSYLELPLLFTVYFAISRRLPIAALLYGMAVGLLQDTFSPAGGPIGVYGIVKTLVGFFSANAGLRMAADNSAIRFLLSFLFYFLHQLFLLVLTRALLGELTQFDPVQTFFVALFNAAVSVPLFQLLDRL